MFDIGWSELLVIGVVALVVIGPKELPRVLRSVGQGVSKLRRMAGEFQGQFNEALREAELSDLKDNVSALRSDLAGLATDARSSFANALPTNPLQDISDDLKAPTGAVERGELPADAIEAQLPPPGDLEPHPFETIENEVRAAAAQLPGEPAKIDPSKPAAAAAPVMAASAPATNAPPAAPEAKPKRRAAASAEATPKPATVRVARKPKAAEPEVATAVAALDDAPARKPIRRTAGKPRVRPKPSGGEGPAA